MKDGSLEILTLGGGSVLFPGRFWSSFVVNGKLLFEAPPSVTINLHQTGVDLLDIETVFVSHLHGDHFAGLPFLLLEYDSIRPRKEPLDIVGPHGTRDAVLKLYETYYPGFPSRPRAYDCNYIEVEGNSTFSTKSTKGTTYHMKHGGGALGFRMEVGEFVLSFTGDTAWCEEIKQLGREANVLVVDCTYAEGREHPTHLSFEDVRALRSELPLTTTIMLTHLSVPISTDSLPNVVAPTDYSTTIFRHQKDAQTT